MSKDLLSLSLTDRPFYNNSVDTSEIFNAFTQTGGEFEYNNTTNLIIGISLLAIAAIIFIGENNWNTTTTNIDYLNCNPNNCTLGLDYQVNNITYKKDFNVDLNYERPGNNQVTITYEISNPSNSYLGTSNYNIIMLILFGFGLFFIGIWQYLSSKKTSTSTFNPSLSFYSKSEIPSEIYTEKK